MTRLVLPDTDRVLSRQTGWSRAHWEALADHLLDSLVPYFSPGASLIALPGRPSRSGTASDALEGFARSFMLAAFRIAGVQGKGCEQLIERYARGVANGANPDHPEAWLRLTPRSQQMVEAAAIAVALHETREWIWDRLDPRAQEHVAEWLGGFNGSTTHDNNWRLFQVVSEQFLASVGAPYSQEDIDGGLDRIEDWYVGDGWYSDGDGQNFDNYIGWAMHLYPGLWTRMAAATPGAAVRGPAEAVSRAARAVPGRRGASGRQRWRTVVPGAVPDLSDSRGGAVLDGHVAGRHSPVARGDAAAVLRDRAALRAARCAG